jgi:hypothetical protein
MTGNSDSGDGGALSDPNLNSDVEAGLRLIRQCKLILEAKEDLSPEAFQQFITRISVRR